MSASNLGADFFYYAVLSVIVDFIAKLIGAEGAKTPAGGPRTARGKRSA
ncbi:hypothetical protein [Neobacillus drentensis]